jgi:large subunit ribosomal protein L15
MQLHQIKSKITKKDKKRIGRGGKRGTYSGKGIKGQKARAGKKIRPQWRDVIKKLPKKRGYRFASIKKKPLVINLDILEKKFNENEKVTIHNLFEKGIIKKIKGRLPEVKLLGSGEITKPLLVSECQISKQAKDKIEKAGGKYVE